MPTTHEAASPAPRVLVGARVKAASESNSNALPRGRGQFGHFAFDFVHDQHSSQEDVFYTSVRPLVHKLLEGNSSAVLLYGPSETGKTYTIEGVGAVGGYKEGLIPRAVALLHHLIETSQHKGSVVVTQSALTTSATPQLLDLQCPGAAPQKLSQTLDQTSPTLPSLHQHCIRHPNNIFQVLGSGKLVGSMGRSPSSHLWKGGSLPVGPGTAHTLLTLSYTRACCTQKGVPETAKLHFVELAAPQNKQAAALDKSKASIAKAHALSKSYNSLTSVLLALKQQRRKQEPNTSVHVPWRECHLTRWLHEALSASSHVVLMGTVAAGAAAAAETLTTLNWLSRFRTDGTPLNGAVWTSPDGAVEGSPHCHERRWPAGYMQWREYELRRLQQEGLSPQDSPSPPALQPMQDSSDQQQHMCHKPEEEVPQEDEQDKARERELKAARKAVKQSLRELNTAEADRASLQCQVNKLSQTLQVQVTALNVEAARIRAHSEADSAAKRQEHERQVQQLQQQLQLAQQEHGTLQARLKASKQAQAAKEAEAAAAAKAAAAAEEAAKTAAAKAKACASAAAVAGAQPQFSSPGFQQLPEQQAMQLLHHPADIMQELQGQRLLGAAAQAGRPASPPRPVTAQPTSSQGTSRRCFAASPNMTASASYAACVQDMQDHIRALKGSLARHKTHRRHHYPNRRVSDRRAALQTQDRSQSGRQLGLRSDTLHTLQSASQARRGSAALQRAAEAGHHNPVDSDTELDQEAGSSRHESCASSSDSDSLDGSKHKAAHSKLLRQFKQLQQHSQQQAQQAQQARSQHEQGLQQHSHLQKEFAARTQEASQHQARADALSKDLTVCQETLEDTRQGFASLQTHHAALKLQLEGAELHSRESAAQAQEFQTRVSALTADRDALASQLALVTASDKQLRKNFKCVVRCLKATDPLQSVMHYSEDLSHAALNSSSDAATALHSDLKWVMRRLTELFKEGRAAQTLAATSASDNAALQERLSQHLEASKSSHAALQTELASMQDRAANAEAEVQLLQQQAIQHAQQLPGLVQSKSNAEQQIGELRAVEEQLQQEVQRLQGQLKAAQGQLQAAEAHLQAELGRLQGQLLQARSEEEEAQEQRRVLKQQLNKVTRQFEEGSSEVAELEGKLSSAQRRAQKHEQDMTEAEAVRAGLQEQLDALRGDVRALQASLEHAQQDRQQAHATVGQVKARLALSERELVLARQEAEGSSKSGTALGQELHAVKRHSQALQQQLTSLQAELEETLDKQQVEARKHDRAVKHAEEGHTAALLGLEGKLAGRQQEVGELQQLNQRLLSRLQTMREQLAHSQDKLSHTQIRGWLDSMVEQFEEARQHHVLHSVRRAEDRWDSFQASARRPETRAVHYDPPVASFAAESGAAHSPLSRTASKIYAELSPLQTQKSSLAREGTINAFLSPMRTTSYASTYTPTTPLGKQVAASADAIRRRLLQSPAAEAQHAAVDLATASSL